MRRPSPQTVRTLQVLAARPGEWQHGYGISRQSGLKSGTLYPILMRLEQRGMLDTHWEEPRGGRPPRHLYRLSTQGARWAGELEASNRARVASPRATSPVRA